MPKKLKSIQEYICKIKTPNSRSFSFILSGCKHPRTASFAVHRADHHGDNHKKDEAATLYDIDQFLLENFKSLYIENGEENHHHQQPQQRNRLETGDGIKKPDVPDICGSHRFFVAIGPSSSLIEEARLSVTRCSDEGGGRSSSTSTTSKTTTICDGDDIGDDDDSTNGDDNSNYGDKEGEDNINGDDNEYIVDDYITVKTYSWNPYRDFRRSMEDMIEAKLEEDGKVDWEFMEELLVSYLNLNEKKSRKFIVSAFVDLTVSLHRRSERVKMPARGGREREEAGRKKSRNVT